MPLCTSKSCSPFDFFILCIVLSSVSASSSPLSKLISKYHTQWHFCCVIICASRIGDILRTAGIRKMLKFVSCLSWYVFLLYDHFIQFNTVSTLKQKNILIFFIFVYACSRFLSSENVCDVRWIWLELISMHIFYRCVMLCVEREGATLSLAQLRKIRWKNRNIDEIK